MGRIGTGQDRMGWDWDGGTWMTKPRYFLDSFFYLVHNYLFVKQAFWAQHGVQDGFGHCLGYTTSKKTYSLDGPKRLDLVHYVLLAGTHKKVSRGFWEERHRGEGS